MSKYKQILFIILQVLLISSVIFVFIYLLTCVLPLSPIKKDLRYQIKTPNNSLIEIFKVPGGATSSDYLQVSVDGGAMVNEVIHNDFLIDELLIRKDSLIISFTDSSINMNPHIIQIHIKR
ncbi:MAG: hypothetical protein J6T04_07475 [Bacteroidales bacterium]|nr:hypothetical protein [Bacteroidales bacterium]